MENQRYPALIQINTRVTLREIAQSQGRAATLNDIPDSYLDQLAEQGFRWVWMLGVWTTGKVARAISQNNPIWRHEMEEALVDLSDDDISGSPFAIVSYDPHPDFGGSESLSSFRQRLNSRGMKLMLDFVPNHTAPDHPWVSDHPEYYVHGTEEQLRNEPFNYRKVFSADGSRCRILAHGKDPYFPGWVDTLQLDYRLAVVHRAQSETLLHIAKQCDAVRCDMAMLLLPDVIERTWSQNPIAAITPENRALCKESFWVQAIKKVREQFPDFLFMAEVYWNRDLELQQQGFDATYDKPLYDHLSDCNPQRVHAHLQWDIAFQEHCTRFLENHDEARAASRFSWEVHQSAAMVTYLAPGIRFVHEGQFEGRTQKVSMHVGRRKVEPVQEEIQNFYRLLFSHLNSSLFHDGQWRLLPCHPEWEANETHRNFIVYAWSMGEQKSLVCVNYSPIASQCFLPLPWDELRGSSWLLKDLMSQQSYLRHGDDLTGRGLYLSMPAWGYHLFELQRTTNS